MELQSELISGGIIILITNLNPSGSIGIKHSLDNIVI